MGLLCNPGQARRLWRLLSWMGSTDRILQCIWQEGCVNPRFRLSRVRSPSVQGFCVFSMSKPESDNFLVPFRWHQSFYAQPSGSCFFFGGPGKIRLLVGCGSQRSCGKARLAGAFRTEHRHSDFHTQMPQAFYIVAMHNTSCLHAFISMFARTSVGSPIFISRLVNFLGW